MSTLPLFTAASALSPLGRIRYGASYGWSTIPVTCDPPCPEGTVCTIDIGFFANEDVVCCAPGEIGCRDACYPPCPGNSKREGINCTCFCSGFYHPNVYPVTQECGEGAILNTATCRCECAPDQCLDYRMVQKINTVVRDDGVTVYSCECECPAPLTDCYGYCADLTNDPLFCGSCDATPCDPFSEKCCNGTCTNVCNDSNCGDCGRAVQAGEKCCNCTPTKLGTNSNCSDCGDVCTGGRICVNGSCQCPASAPECGGICCSSPRECCNGTCCPTGTRCCNGACVNVNTSTSHCGGCNQPCPQGASCVNGQCQCPPNRIVCNLPTAQCVDNMTPSTGQGAQWQVTWRQANPNVPFFTCPNGQLTCASTLVQIGQGCCPPGSTRVVNGLCQ